MNTGRFLHCTPGRRRHVASRAAMGALLVATAVGLFAANAPGADLSRPVISRTDLGDPFVMSNYGVHSRPFETVRPTCTYTHSHARACIRRRRSCSHPPSPPRAMLHHACAQVGERGYCAALEAFLGDSALIHTATHWAHCRTAVHQTNRPSSTFSLTSGSSPKTGPSTPPLAPLPLSPLCLATPGHVLLHGAAKGPRRQGCVIEAAPLLFYRCTPERKHTHTHAHTHARCALRVVCCLTSCAHRCTCCLAAAVRASRGFRYWGYVTSCGTEGNLHSILVARECHPDAVLITSKETHYSVGGRPLASFVWSLGLCRHPAPFALHPAAPCTHTHTHMCTHMCTPAHPSNLPALHNRRAAPHSWCARATRPKQVPKAARAYRMDCHEVDTIPNNGEIDYDKLNDIVAGSVHRQQCPTRHVCLIIPSWTHDRAHGSQHAPTRRPCLYISPAMPSDIITRGPVLPHAPCPTRHMCPCCPMQHATCTRAPVHLRILWHRRTLAKLLACHRALGRAGKAGARTAPPRDW